jgi:hypothetical protein
MQRLEVSGAVRHIYMSLGVKGLIEKLHGIGREIGPQLTGSSGSKSMDENDSCYNDPQVIHILNERLCHFVPILRKTSAPNKPIEKQTNYPFQMVFSNRTTQQVD